MAAVGRSSPRCRCSDRVNCACVKNGRTCINCTPGGIGQCMNRQQTSTSTQENNLVCSEPTSRATVTLAPTDVPTTLTEPISRVCESGDSPRPAPDEQIYLVAASDQLVPDTMVTQLLEPEFQWDNKVCCFKNLTQRAKQRNTLLTSMDD